MGKLLVICGPTATGKTELGIKLAQKLDGEIVSADSRQVYRGMDIGTGKDLSQSAKLKVKSEKLLLKVESWKVLKSYRFNKIPVWLLDVVDPDREFSVAQYYDLAWRVIEDIWRRRKLPILVGGTGFYIKAVVDGIESLGVEPDWELRRILGDKDIKILGEDLKKIWPERWKKMNESDRKNPRRLTRAIEIAIKVKTSASAKASADKQNSKLKTFFIGLKAPYPFLYRRIDQRVEERVKKGIVEEIKALLKKGYDWNLPSMSGMGYREFRDFFEKKATLKEVIQRWKFDEHGYARRQMTWFRKDPRIHWFDISESSWQEKVERLVRRWYT